MDDEEFGREGEGYIAEDDYDWSDESESSDDSGLDDLPRGHAWPDPFDSGTEASGSPPQSARSDPSAHGLPVGTSSTQSRMFLQSLGKRGQLQAEFTQYGEEAQRPLPSQSSQQPPEMLRQLQLPNDPQGRCAPFDSGRSSSATSKGSQFSDRKATLAAGAAEGSRQQPKRPGRRAACGRAAAQECTKKEKVDAHAERCGPLTAAPSGGAGVAAEGSSSSSSSGLMGR